MRYSKESTCTKSSSPINCSLWQIAGQVCSDEVHKLTVMLIQVAPVDDVGSQGAGQCVLISVLFQSLCRINSIHVSYSIWKKKKKSLMWKFRLKTKVTKFFFREKTNVCVHACVHMCVWKWHMHLCLKWKTCTNNAQLKTGKSNLLITFLRDGKWDKPKVLKIGSYSHRNMERRSLVIMPMCCRVPQYQKLFSMLQYHVPQPLLILLSAKH